MTQEDILDTIQDLKEQVRTLNDSNNELKSQIKHNTQLIKSSEIQIQKLEKKLNNKHYRDDS